MVHRSSQLSLWTASSCSSNHARGTTATERDYNMRLVEHHNIPGDIVYKLDSTTKVGRSSKLRPPWKDLYLVISCKASHYTFSNQNKEQVLHYDRLKLYKERDIPMWLRCLCHRLWKHCFRRFRLNSACDRAQSERGSQCVYLMAGPSQNQRHRWWILFIIGGSSPPSKYKDFVYNWQWNNKKTIKQTNKTLILLQLFFIFALLLFLHAFTSSYPLLLLKASGQYSKTRL